MKSFMNVLFWLSDFRNGKIEASDDDLTACYIVIDEYLNLNIMVN